MVSLCFLAFLFERRKADKPKNVLQDLIPPRCEVSRKRDGSSFILSGFSRAVLAILSAESEESISGISRNFVRSLLAVAERSLLGLPTQRRSEHFSRAFSGAACAPHP
jgi:hypothetical protein